MGFEVLEATGRDGERWSELITRLPPALRDIHFLPEYGLVYQRTYGHRPQLAVYHEGEDFLLQPFVRRSLKGLPFLEGDPGPEPFDISNPYGYGGPLCSSQQEGRGAALYGRFDRCFTDFCRRERLASEFTSLHPLLANHRLLAASPHQPLPQKEVVVIDLTGPEERLWKGLNRGHRSGVNKAIRAGVRVFRVEPDDRWLESFNRLYYHTMRRHQASGRWFFPPDYFRNCRDLLGTGRVSLFVAQLGEEVAAMYFLMHDFATAYYHFGASDERFFELRPNNLLMYQAARWAREAGYSRFHLGGGVGSTADDPLYRYKAGFSPLSALLYTYGRVLDPDTYHRLCRLKASHEVVSLGRELESDYFPLYRR